MSGLFDTHAHLPLLEHRTAPEAVARANAEGVEFMTTVSTEFENWEKNRALAHQFKNIYYTVGLHPHEAKDWPKHEKAMFDFLTEHRNDGKCVGVGETGLDFFYNHSDRDAQIESFEDQIDLSKQFELPLIIHSRDAFVETYGSLRKVGMSKRAGIMHCFTGNTAQALEAVELGLYISFSGIVTFKNADSLREAAKNVPHERILIETDCPFLTPLPHRGVPNEPFYLPYTAKVLSGLLGLRPEKFAEITTANAKRVFL